MSGTSDDEEQHSFFSPAFQVLLYVIVFSAVMGCLTSVFNFYSFDYTQYYSIIFFYLFLITCTFILPVRMIGVTPPDYAQTVQQLTKLVMKKDEDGDGDGEKQGGEQLTKKRPIVSSPPEIKKGTVVSSSEIKKGTVVSSSETKKGTVVEKLTPTTSNGKVIAVQNKPTVIVAKPPPKSTGNKASSGSSGPGNDWDGAGIGDMLSSISN